MNDSRETHMTAHALIAAVALLGMYALFAADNASAADEKTVVVIDTNLGPITVELYPDKAPATVKNFLNYVDKNFYDGTIFHRVIPDFMAQGGGFTEESRGPGDTKKPDAPVKNEAGNGLKNERGTLAMARTSDPDSATSQFFINLSNNGFLDRAQAQDGVGYTVFGKVIDGLDVVDKMASIPTVRNRISEGYPTKPIVIKGVKRKS